MVEDAGTIQAEIRLDIDNLMKGAMEAQKAIKDLETEMKKSKAEINNAFRNGTRAVFDYGVELKNISLAEKTGSKTAREAAQARLAAAQKYLDVLIDVRNRIAEANGEDDKQVAVYDRLIKKQVKLRDSMRETGETGTGFFAGIKRGFKESGDEAKKLGANIAKALTPALVGLTAGIKAIQAVGGAIRDAFLSNEKFREGIGNLKSALGESFSAAVRPVSNFFASIIESAAKGIKQANDLREALKRLKSEVPDYGDTLDEELKNAQKDFDALNAKANQLREDMANPLNADIMSALDDDLKKTLLNLDKAKYKLEELAPKVGNATPGSLKIFKEIEEELAAAEKQISLLYEKDAIDEGEANQSRLSALNNYINAVSKLIAENDIANSNINKGLDDQIAQYNTLEKEIESQKTSESLLAQAKEAYGKAMAQVQNQEKAGFIDAEGAMAKRLQAEQQYIQALSGLRNEYGQLEGVTDRQREDIAALEAAHIADAAALETVIAYQKEYAAETERLRAQYEGVTAEMGGQASLAEIMAEEAERRARELERQRDAELAALETRYAAIAAERESGELTEEETEHREALTDAINKNYDALQKLGKTEAVAAAQKGIAGYAGEIKDQYDGILRDLAEQRIMRDESLSDYEKEIALNQMARDAALDELDARFGALEAQREGLGLTEEEAALKKELTRQINGNYDAIRRGIKEAEKEGVNFKEVTLQIARASVNAFTSVTSAVATIAQNRAAEAMAEVDRVLGETQKHIEDARLEALEAEGFIEAQRAENMQAQIDAAIEANDEVLQYQLERRKREMEINEEYDAQAKAEQEKAEKEKAELEYKAARTKYEMDITNAIVTGAMAISNAIAAGWGAGFPMGPVLAGVFGTAAAVSTGAQLAVIRSNPPALKYATGGIVPGQTHAGTDTVAAMLTPGEVILNRAQQENLAPQLGGGPLTVVVNLDGRPIAETVIKDYVNRGLVLIEAKRGIR